MQKCRQILLGGVLAMMFMTSGCNMTTPSEVGVNKIRVRDKTFTETLRTDHVDKQQVATVARDIQRSGANEATLLVPYTNGDIPDAWRIGLAYKKAFAAKGITNFTVNVVAMEKGQPAKEAVLSYEGLAALAPEGCGRIPGYQGSETLEGATGYQYGCETKAALSKMVANPSDLMGTAPPAEAESRRNGPLNDNYMSGKPNQKMGGYSASSIGASQ